MRPSSVVTLLTMLLLAGLPARTSACTCLETPFRTAYTQSDVILLGEVLGVESAAPDYPHAVWATIRVEAVWKGTTAAEVRVLTAASGVSCGYTFEPGMRYLVYAFTDGWPSLAAGEMWTTLCWRTHPYWAGDPDLVALGVTGLSDGFPNPSQGAFEFALHVLEESRVSWAVFDLQGRTVWSEERSVGAGHTLLRWDGMTSSRGRAASGVYLIRASVDGTRFTRRIVRF
jgi:hypothetical protein